MTDKENAVLEDIDDIEFDEAELTIEDLEASLQAELEAQLADLSQLEEDREKIGNPDSLGKVILDKVWTEFGKQIGLEATNETLIQEYERKHPEEYNKEIADAIMQDERYKEANARMKQQHQEGTLVDEYTGKTMSATEDKPNLDHVVPRKEIYDNKRRKQANIDTKDLANKEENLAATNESLNKSKKDKSNKQYVEERAQREENLKKQNEAAHKKIDESNKSDAEKRIEHEQADKRMQDKLDADDEKMMEADEKARKAIDSDIAKGATKQTAKKAGKDALKMMAVTALFDLLKSIMNGLVRFFKEKHKSFKLFLTEMKESIKRFINHITSFVRTGASTFVGTVLSEIFGPVVSMFKKLASFIKQGVTTIVEAVQYLVKKENRNAPWSIKIAKVAEIVTGGLATAGALVGGELIEKALMQIPVMSVTIPVIDISLASITGSLLASLLFGIIGAIVVNKIEQFIANKQRSDNTNSQIDKKNEILQTQDKLITVKAEKLDNTIKQTNQTIRDNHKKAAEIMSEALATIFEEDDEEDFDDMFAKLDEEMEKLKS